jgi:hypothetical protein
LLALLSAALVGIAAILGRAAGELAGTDTWRSLVPFAGVVLCMVLAGVPLLLGWRRLRRPLAARFWWLPFVLAVCIAVTAAWFALQPGFRTELGPLRSAMGGADAAARSTISHQVYAAYRRADAKETLQVLERSRVFEPTVREAAAAFDVDAELLMGIAAAESSFYPRDSKDGGRGLFQLTAAPQGANSLALKRLGVAELDPLNQRHNAFVAAATLRHYLAAMRGDLFLGLLAYNIGPRNGGLLSIMKQYGARDFVTIQPYLQNLPRDYPIRVLSAALAYRLWRTDGTLPRYEEGDNATRVQRVGIPGLQAAQP